MILSTISMYFGAILAVGVTMHCLRPVRSKNPFSSMA